MEQDIPKTRERSDGGVGDNFFGKFSALAHQYRLYRMREEHLEKTTGEPDNRDNVHKVKREMAFAIAEAYRARTRFDVRREVNDAVIQVIEDVLGDNIDERGRLRLERKLFGEACVVGTGEGRYVEDDE